MSPWLSWVKSNEKEILTILDNLAIKAKETAEQLVNLLANMDKSQHYQEEIKKIGRAHV